MNTRSVVIVALLLVFAGCKSSAPTDIVIRKPIERASVTPTIKDVAKPISDAKGNATSLRSKVDKLEWELYLRKKDVASFEAQLEEARANGLTAQEELAMVWAQLTKQKERNMFMETSTIPDLKVTITELETNLESAEVGRAMAEELSILKDAEAEELRSALTEADTKLGAIPKLQQEVSKWKGKYDSAKVYKTWLIVIASAFGLVVVLFLVIKYISYTTGLRGVTRLGPL